MATRRSGRLAGQPATNPAADSKTVASKKKEKKGDFAVDDIVDKIIKNGASAPALVKLTKDQLIGVVVGLTDRYHQRDEALLDQQHEAAVLEVELEKARDMKWTLRRAEFDRVLAQERLKAEKEKEKAAQVAAQAAPVLHNTSVVRKPTPASEMEVETPTASARGNIAPSETPAPAPSTPANFLQRTAGFFHKLISSPAKRNDNQPQQALGQLPANRKRSAPTEVTEPANTTSMSNVTNSAPRASTTSNKLTAPDHVHTISGQLEESTPAPHTTNTPARPQNTPRAMSARRPIQQVREDKRRREMLRQQTPLRAWDRTPVPRVPNADSRLQKLHMYNQLKQKMKELQEDEELEDVIERPIKRVKVDELAEIPHRLPGDPKSTFRMPDPDTDGEMEIDEEIEHKSNVFEASQAEEKQKEGQMNQQPVGNVMQPARNGAPETAAPKAKIPWATPSPPKQYAPPTAQDVPDVWAFPSVGVQQTEDITAQQTEEHTTDDIWSFPTVGEIDVDQIYNELDLLLGKKFAYGLEGWQRGVQAVEW